MPVEDEFRLLEDDRFSAHQLVVFNASHRFAVQGTQPVIRNDDINARDLLAMLRGDAVCNVSCTR